MISKSKLLVSLLSVAIFATGCSSNSQKASDSAATDAANAVNEVVTTETTEVAADPRDALVGVDTIFYFDFDQSLLRSEARAALLIHASVIKELNTSVRLEGHADERGSREYNMALGERRANAARDFLVLQGVSAALIETVSFGEERPAVVGSSDSVYSQNRRVEIKY